MRKRYRVFQLLLLICISFFLTACSVPASQQFLPEVSYTKPIMTHSKKHLLLTWTSGDAVPSERSLQYIVHSPGLLGAVIDIAGAEIVADHNRHLTPDNTYQFGVARQASFISSLRKALIVHHVFQSVQMVPVIKKLKPSQVGIEVIFKSTQVTGMDSNSEITLDVLLRIKTAGKKKAFSRGLFVQSGPIRHIKGRKYFLYQQKVVAQKLLRQIIIAIDQWHKQI